MAKSKRRLQPVPEFASEAEERGFWETHDSVDYIDWSEAQRVTFPKALQPTSRPRKKATRARTALN